MGRKGYPAEFRRRALDLVAAGKTVREVARLCSQHDRGESLQELFGIRLGDIGDTAY